MLLNDVVEEEVETVDGDREGVEDFVVLNVALVAIAVEN